MPTVFDNIDTPFLENEHGNGLKDALKLAWRGDFCVGYCNLRGWRCIDAVVGSWPHPAIDGATPPCRLLVGMQRLPHEQLQEWLSNKALARLLKNVAKGFCKWLASIHRR